jgi:hypothetical protein
MLKMICKRAFSIFYSSPELRNAIKIAKELELALAAVKSDNLPVPYLNIAN